MGILRKILHIVILGAPASGKGTISKRIVKHYGFSHIAPGDILRQSVQNETELGKNVKYYLDKGKLVPDELVINCVISRLSELGNQSWLLDGFPRNIIQAKSLTKNQDISAVIYLKVPTEEIIERTKGRWIHLPSGRVYNTDFNQPKILYKDDITGDELVQRDDDKQEIVEKRLAIYEEITKPVLEYYRELNLLHEFPGRTSDEIWPNIEEFLVGKTLRIQNQ